MAELTNNIDRHIGSRVVFMRGRLGVCANSAADALGLNAEQLRKRELGQVRFSAKELQKLTKLLSVQPSYFFEGIGAAVCQCVDGASKAFEPAESARI